MRPTIGEQLLGLRRILAEVVAPEVTHPYPADILRGVMAGLEALERGWYEVPRFLRWDAAATAAILMDARPALDEQLRAEITAVCGAEPEEPLELEVLEARHDRLRALLARAAPVLAAGAEHQALNDRVVELFRQRAERFPFGLQARPSAPVPSS